MLYPNVGVTHFYGTLHWSYHAIARFKLKIYFFCKSSLTLNGSEQVSRTYCFPLVVRTNSECFFQIERINTIWCLSLRQQLAPPAPFPSKCVSPPGVDTLACGGVGGGSQFRHPARNSGTLCTLLFFSSAKWFRTEFRAFLSSAEWLGTEFRAFSAPRKRRNSVAMNQNFCSVFRWKIFSQKMAI